jgi:hypothetical protein
VNQSFEQFLELLLEKWTITPKSFLFVTTTGVEEKFLKRALT